MPKLSRCVVLLLMFSSAQNAAALNWDFQTVRDSYDKAGARSVTVGTDGRIHVIYSAHVTFDDTNVELDHAVRTPATSWAVTTLASTASNIYLYGSAEVKCDSAQHPYVVYRLPSGSMRFMRHTGTAWTSPLSLSGSGDDDLALATAIDSANDLHVGYTVAGGTLRYAFWDRSANTLSYLNEVHDFTYVYEQVSMALHPTSGRPRLTYTRNDDLTFTVRGSAITSAWTPEIVRANSVTAKSVCGGSVTFLGTTEYASYYDMGNQGLYLATDSGNPWARELVGTFDMESVNSIAPSTRLFFDSAQKPYIVWRLDGGALYVSSKRGSTWKTTLIAEASEAAFGATMSGDRLYVAYATPDRTSIQLATAGVSPAAQFSGWAESVFTPTQLADPLIAGGTADPDRDGVVNLLEFALNMHPLTSSGHTLAPGTGTQGLPVAVAEGGSGGTPGLRYEYVRRRAAVNAGITYTPEFAPSPFGPWTAATGTPTVTPINDEWERVVVVGAPASGPPSHYARLRITQDP